MQAAVLCGYPGSIASAWQQMGRAGRTRDAALAILVATAGALDQYLVQHAEYLFERTPEHALINPDNLMLLVDQIRCAAFELPFAVDDPFGASAYTGDVLSLLQEEGDLHAHGAGLFWSGAGYPARDVSLRSSGADSVSIQVMANTGEPNIIGQVDRGSAPNLVHEGAIYLHEGQSYLVQRLNLDQLLAEVIPVNVDYYTETTVDTQVTVLAQHGERSTPHESAAFGDVAVTSQVAGYRRIKRHTHETLGVQPLEYPPQTVETAAYWLAISAETQRALEAAGLWYDSVNDYGPNWDAVRAAVRQRDGFRCTQCRRPEPPGQEHDVHHKTPFRTFGYVRGVNEQYLLANRLENLVLVCRSCHQRIETAGRLVTGLDGLAYVLANLAPLYLMCDRSDLGMHVDKSQRLAGSAGGKLATLYLFERTPAGLGFSAQLFDLHPTLLAAAQDLVTRCRCQQGCPACVGPVLDSEPAQLPAKQLTLGLLERMVVR
ncbi:MAG: DUF1998 domain-containing protein [Anaerolineales bacterium]|nr:DUF1998 domain-containing protein [Anaerolineales bacterium]